MKNLITYLAITFFIIPTFVGAQVQNKNLEAVLLDVTDAGQTELVRSFLDHGANIETKNEVGATPLIFASAKGHQEIVALLLDRRANVNAQTRAGITPLMAAASGGYVDIVKLLLAKGANVSAKDEQGRTALNLAEAADNSEVSRYYQISRSAFLDTTTWRRTAVQGWCLAGVSQLFRHSYR